MSIELVSITYNDIARTGAIRDGHFIGKSGQHMPRYIAKEHILADPCLVTKISRAFAQNTKRTPADVVVGPAVGGAILAQTTAGAIAHMRSVDQQRAKIDAVFTESKNGIQRLRPSFSSYVRGRRAVVVDDTVNTTKSIGETVEAVREAGGNVILALSIINRNKTDTEIGKKIKTPYRSLIKIPLPSYPAGHVPLELMKVPINTDYGHGAEYLAQNK